MNAGGVKTSGTPGEKHLEFDLHHIPWFGSIYLPKQVSQDAAQESRIVKLELKKLQDNVPVLNKIEADEGAKLAAEIVAAVISEWKHIEEVAKGIAQKRCDIIKRMPGIQIRTVDNFMYASALLNISTNRNYDVPEWVNMSNEDDGEKIVSLILSSLIHVLNDSYSISDCIEKAMGEQTKIFSKPLENIGIKHTTNAGSRYLAIRSPAVVRFLLKDTDYKDKDIQAPLSRIEGAISSHPVKFSGKHERCVLIPLSYVMGDGMGERNHRNPSVTPNVTNYIPNNERDANISYEGFAKHDDENKKSKEADLFGKKIYENVAR